MKIAVVGGGISGLAAAYRLREAGHDVVVLEAGERCGGKIRSESRQGYLVEHGPNGFLSSRLQCVRLAKDLGIGHRLVAAQEAAKYRFLYLNGRLQAVPVSPPAFFKSNLLPLSARLRAMKEPVVAQQMSHDGESVYDFAARRLGPVVAERMVDAMVTGIHAGDARLLSVQAAFPRLVEMEREHGSVVRALIAAKKKSDKSKSESPRLTCFPNGFGEMIDALVGHLDDGSIHTNRPVTGLEKRNGRWHVQTIYGEPIEVDGIVLTTPTYQMAQLLKPHSEPAASALEQIPYAPVAVVAVGYPRRMVDHGLDGFGFLIPSGERRRLLGVLWSSTLFAERAPNGQVLLRCILGGAYNPQLVDLDDDELLAVVTAELSHIFGCNLVKPAFHRIVRWPIGIPQYTIGHLERVRTARLAAAAQGGLFLAGNGLVGVSVADCIGHAETLPSMVNQRLRRP